MFDQYERKKIQPIIIRKRITNSNIENTRSYGHGSWKVAYADFITTLMAFFLLLWLLNSTPSKKLIEMSNYFQPTIGIFHKHAKDTKNIVNKAEFTVSGEENNNESVLTQQNITDNNSYTEIHNLDSENKEIQSSINLNHGSKENTISTFEKKLRDMISNDVKKSIYIENSNDGLVITIMDDANDFMFATGSHKLQKSAKDKLKNISTLIKYIPNKISIDGYTDQYQDKIVSENSLLNKKSTNKAYTLWELSADRANSARQFLEDSGIAPERIARITAYADTKPLIKNNSNDPRNRRISITILGKSETQDYKKAFSEDFIIKSMNGHKSK